ncbi:DUF4179 domain-containing protein [Cohnella suwonensis]|uniref:DUF4179 domain-containing protein n=1 Tax=Cohnella suwonensis TaxID=696072 RepID=A0ABW0LZU7_9BACL
MNEQDLKRAKSYNSYEANIELIKRNVLKAISEHGIPKQVTRKPRYRFAVAVGTAAMVIGLFGSSFVSPAIAKALKQLPLMESVFKLAGDWGLQTADERGQVTEVRQSITRNGTTLSVSSVLYDGVRLAVGITQQSEKGIEEIVEVEPVIDGKSIHWPGSQNAQAVDSQTSVYVSEWRPNTDLPDKFNLQMLVFLKNSGERWEFNIPVERLKDDQVIMHPMITKHFDDDKTMTVKKVTLTATTSELLVDFEVPEGIQATDMFFELSDERGTTVQALSANGYGKQVEGRERVEHRITFTPFETLPKAVTIRPYLRKSNDDPMNPNYIKELEVNIPIRP